MNNTVRVSELVKATRSSALILLLTAGLLCNACGPSVATPAGTSQPATATALPGPVATAGSTTGEVGSQPATATPIPVAVMPTPTPTVVAVTPTPAPRPIRVIKAIPAVEVTGNEDYPFNNCGGTEELRRPFSEAAQIWTEVAAADQATRSDGALIPVSEPLRSELAREVELAYQEELALAQTTLDQSEMVAGAYTRWSVVVIWEARVFSAGISFPADGLSATTVYTYTQHVPVMGYFKSMACTP